MASLWIIGQLAGAVALLLFGLGLVRDGMTEALGLRLKMILGLGTRTPLRAALAGLVATLGLQSSTATALLTASFAERGMITPRRAQGVMAGANLGTALTAWVVAAGGNAVAPVLVLAGCLLRRRGKAPMAGFGLAVVGIGLMLLSLTLLEGASEPLRASPTVAAFLRMLDMVWLAAFAFSALLAILFSSSLAVVMLVMSLEAGGGLSPSLAVVLVLGANFGGAIPPVLATLAAAAPARRVTVGNLVARGLGCGLALPLAGQIAALLTGSPLGAGRLPVGAHLGFNLALLLVILPLTGLLARLVAHLVPDAAESDATLTNWLDDGLLGLPALALTAASREVLAIGDRVERMLMLTMTAFRNNDPAPLAEVSELEAAIDEAQQRVKLYLSRLGSACGEADQRRAIAILDYVINLEHIGDIIDKGLTPEVATKISHSLRFSDEGYGELSALFILTLDNLKIAQTIFMSRDKALARRLVEMKVDIRRMERASADHHLQRLQNGVAESLQTSSLHLDMLRDLKRISAHVVSVAYPILDEEGLLIESRLRTTPGA
jgi:phosphate:Na+ symporter